MSFFDNWRVQLASLNKYNDNTEEEISHYENKYQSANEVEKKKIFDIYSEQTNRVQTNLVSNISNSQFLGVGDMIDAMWIITCQTYPHLSIIDDSDVKHAILQCRIESQQEAIFNEWKKKQTSTKN